MRLIDADKVKQYVLTEGFYCDTEADREYTARRIDELFPTVEALPVEWIKTEKEKYPFYYQDGIDLILFKWEEYSTRKIWEAENEIG